MLKFKDSNAAVRTNVPILDGIVYRKKLARENPLMIRAKMAGDYQYGTVPEAGVEWWRPINFSRASEDVLCYTSSDAG